MLIKAARTIVPPDEMKGGEHARPLSHNSAKLLIGFILLIQIAEHRIAAGALRRDILNDVPVLHDFPLIQAEEVESRLPAKFIRRGDRGMPVHSDKISVRQDMLDGDHRRGVE